jgi:antitoxin component YwqK of YwqJK toxin-antitoxin module
VKVPYVKYHTDGSVWAKGHMEDGVMEGYWEWYRVDGSKMRSGHFRQGKQIGEWITYDPKGKAHKITNIVEK